MTIHHFARRLTLIVAALAAQATFAQSPQAVDAATIERWMTELSNWNRWGEKDTLGALNLITPAKRKAALALARDGVSVSLARNYVRDAQNNERSGFRHEMFGVAQSGPFVTDRYSFMYHGYLFSHMDALCHMSHKGKMYNGFPREQITDAGCGVLSITDAKEGIVTRAVLMDIARLKGVEGLAPGTPIYVEDLEAWEKKAGVKVQAGDLLLLHTGRWAGGQDRVTPQSGAGLHASVAPWLKQRDIALIGSEYATDVAPSGIEGARLPLHQLMLVAMGVRIFDNLDLQAVAAEAAKRQRWAFTFVAAPVPIAGGTGSPLNPIAIF